MSEEKASFQRTKATKRFLNRKRALSLYDKDVVNNIEAHILKTDTYADAVVDEFDKIGAKQGWAYFEDALNNGVDSVPDAPIALKNLFDELDNIPDWVDWKQIERGGIAYWRAGPLSGLALKCASLAAGYRSAAAAKPLMFTGRLIEKAETRVVETSRWTLNASAPGKMKRFEDGFKYTARVRLIHAFVRSRLMSLPEWDYEAWGCPINLTDTNYGISGEFGSVAINAVRKCGIHYSKKEREDMYALWRYIGFVLGVPESLLMKNEADALLHMEIKELTDTPADKDSRALVKALVENGGDDRELLPELMGSVLREKDVHSWLYGAIRYLAGDDAADDLSVPNHLFWKNTLRLLKPSIRIFDSTRHLRDETDRQRAEHFLAEMEKLMESKDRNGKLAPKKELSEGIQRHKLSVTQ